MLARCVMRAARGRASSLRGVFEFGALVVQPLWRSGPRGHRRSRQRLVATASLCDDPRLGLRDLDAAQRYVRQVARFLAVATIARGNLGFGRGTAGAFEGWPRILPPFIATQRREGPLRREQFL